VEPKSELYVRAQIIYQVLLVYFGFLQWDEMGSPLDELVSTILSQNTNDRNRDAAYQSLRLKFPTWEGVRDALAIDVVAAIRIAGLANQKGPRIQAVLRQITEERGSLDLDFLRSLSREDAQEWLLRFKGVGPKTAAIVMQFALGKPAFPVDTHVYRVTGRLGLRPARMPVEQTQMQLESIFEPETYGPAHIYLIRLGRRICHARKPDCPGCPLTGQCDFYLSGESAKIRSQPGE
jgi:endonuclease-3